MADKITTLKTKTGDNVYPNIIGTNRKDGFADSSTIKHYYYDKTHKVGFQLANETNNKITNSLQKPTGLTKTELVGVGTNGQENIEIGDNLTLANGKLSASGGGGSGGLSYNILVGTIENLDDKGFSGTYTGNIDISKINVISISDSMYVQLGYINTAEPISGNTMIDVNGEWYSLYVHSNQFALTRVPLILCTHFITLTKDHDSIYLQYSRMSHATDEPFDMDSLSKALSGKKTICTGILGNSDETIATPMYLSGEAGGLEIYYVLKMDNSISNKSITDYDISDLVSSGD